MMIVGVMRDLPAKTKPTVAVLNEAMRIMANEKPRRSEVRSAFTIMRREVSLAISMIILESMMERNEDLGLHPAAFVAFFQAGEFPPSMRTLLSRLIRKPDR